MATYRGQSASKNARKRLLAAGIVPQYVAGQVWRLPSQQFQALYKKVGTYDEARRLADIMISLPEGKPSPEDYVWRRWAFEYDAGDSDVPPKVERVIAEKLTAMRMAGLWRTLQTTSAALETVAKKSADGNLPQATQSQLLSLGNAFNYGMGSLAAMEKQMHGQQNASLNITGHLRLDAGAPPSTRVKKSLRPVGAKVLTAGAEAQLVEGEFREVPAVGDSNS